MKFPFKKKEFVQVAAEGAISNGSMAEFEVGDRKVAVARIEGAYYAFDNICTHMQCPLHKGWLRGKTVVCPCHVSEFDVTNGAVVKGPAQKPVRSYPVRIESGSIEVQV
ncbi:MAG: Rieske (2Fe-2S) protein [Actinomycetota bacterium]